MPEVETNQTQAVQTPSKPLRRPAGQRKKKIFKTIVSLAVAAAILGGGGVGLYRFLTATEDVVGEIYSEPATIGTIQSSVSGYGTARSKESAAITLSQDGTVKEVFVAQGDRVMAGQPLYTIDSQAAQDEVARVQAVLDALKEDMLLLEQEAANLTVRAPFPGKLTNVREFAPDQMVTKGETVATLVNDRKLKLSLYYSYAYEKSIRVGQSVTVSIPAVMGTFSGQVETINKVEYISPEGGVFFEVVITFANPGTLTADMAASASMTAPDGTPIYPYENGKTRFYETREVRALAAGPVTKTGTLLNYAGVSEGTPLLYLGSADVDSRIRAKQDEIDKALLSVQQAQEALGNFNAVAPIDGTIITCNLQPEAEVKKDTTVIIISNTATMLVDITVDDRNISFIKPGSFVDLDWNGMMYQGQVTAVDLGNAQSGSGMTNYPVTLSVENFDGSLMDGAWLQYSFVTSESADCIVVQGSAVKYFSDSSGQRQSVVFVQRETRPDNVPELELPTFEPGQKRTFPSDAEGFYPVIVETGLSNTQFVEIVSGIEVGDQVFINYTVTEMGSSWG